MWILCAITGLLKLVLLVALTGVLVSIAAVSRLMEVTISLIHPLTLFLLRQSGKLVIRISMTQPDIPYDTDAEGRLLEGVSPGLTIEIVEESAQPSPSQVEGENGTTSVKEETGVESVKAENGAESVKEGNGTESVKEGNGAESVKRESGAESVKEGNGVAEEVNGGVNTKTVEVVGAD